MGKVKLEAAHGLALGKAREAVPARKRTELFPTDLDVEPIGDEAVRAIFRCDTPYERYDMVLPVDAAKVLGGKLIAVRVEKPSPIIDIR